MPLPDVEVQMTKWALVAAPSLHSAPAIEHDKKRVTSGAQPRGHIGLT
jgi:hypothetical protein